MFVICAILLFIVSAIYIYLFFYFAAGCYYKQQILLDKDIFFSATLRFISAIVLFVIALLVASFAINLGINFIKISIGTSFDNFLNMALGSYIWQIGKYVCIFLIFITFFLIPSFSFISEITGKNKSLFVTYIKTKGNILRISFVTFISFVLMVCLMLLLANINIWLASFVRSIIFVFISILYFKMYDFFYLFPNRGLNTDSDVSKSKNNTTSKQRKKVNSSQLES